MRPRWQPTKMTVAELAAAHKAGKLFAVIWTTTPWTLPANLGISLNETFDYVALKSGDNYYIVADEARRGGRSRRPASRWTSDIPLSREALKALDGKDIFRHPFLDRDVKLMYGDARHRRRRHRARAYRAGPRLRGFRGRQSSTACKPMTPVDGAGIFTSGEWQGQNVFDANPADRRASEEQSARCCTARRTRTAIRIAGDATIR